MAASTLRATVSHGNSAGSWNTMPILRPPVSMVPSVVA